MVASVFQIPLSPHTHQNKKPFRAFFGGGVKKVRDFSLREPGCGKSQTVGFFFFAPFKSLPLRNFKNPLRGLKIAEREGFEPSRAVKPCHVSSVVLSATQPPLHITRPPAGGLKQKTGASCPPGFLLKPAKCSLDRIQPTQPPLQKII